MRITSSKAFWKFQTLSFRSLLSFVLLFILGCTISPERRTSLASSEDYRLIRVGSESSMKELQNKQSVVRILEGKKEGTRYLLVKMARDSLSGSLRTLKAKQGVEEVKISDIRLQEKGIPSPELPKADPPSNIELPDIFDIFTRIY